MKKRYTLAVCLIIASLLLVSGTATIDAYDGAINDAFDFEIIKCENDFTIGSTTANAQGFEIDGHHFDQGTTVNFNITSFPFLSIQYNISADGYSEIGSNNLIGDLLDHYSYTIFPQSFLDIYYNTSDWNGTTLEIDPGYEFIPFINNGTFTWANMVNFVEESINQTYLTSPETALAYTNATYTNSTTEFYLEYYLYGVIQQNVTDGGQLFMMSVDVEHHYQFAYNKTNNAMLGFRLMGTLDGNSNGSALAIDYDYHTELVGYDLPALLFGIEDIVTPKCCGFDNLGLILGLGIGIPVVLILTTVTVVMIAKKKK